METDDCADVLRALLAQGRGFPPLEAETDDRSTTLSGVPFAAYGGMGGWQMREAERLYHAERRRLPEVLVSRRRTGLALHDAYRVQWYGVALRVREGARVVGHKVGLTSRAMQDQVGIDTPDSGILLDYMAVPPGEALLAAELLSPRIEAEIAFRLGTDLCGTDVAEQAARGAVAEAFLALEVIDSRFDLDEITLADSVADNAACARFVLGEAVPMPSWDLRAERLTVRTGTTPVAAGEGRDVLGDPIRSVVWLARRLAAFGAGLKAGDVVLAGAVHASFPLPAGETVSVSSPRLPAVSLHVA
ncbi:MAG: 2-keto-4-pentenoate hydratase [Pseudonocardiaceae bacterium]